MARIFPSDIEAVAAERFEKEEVETLQNLRDDLPDNFLLYHSVYGSRTEAVFRRPVSQPIGFMADLR